jgi:malignant T-cell-amplified sequence
MLPTSIAPGAKSKVKSSVQRTIRTKVLEEYPALTPYIDTIMPKKSQLDLVKLPDRVSLYVLDGVPLFFQHMDDAIIPHLTLVHKYPDAFHRIRIDRGAIRFVMSGAALMAPGLTSPGGRLPGEEDLDAGEVVVVEAEGKEHACLVGTLKVGTKEIKKVKKGVAVEQGHYLGDGLWRLKVD